MDNSVLVMAGVISVASQIFGPWEKVTPANIQKPVPLFTYQNSSLGSVEKMTRGDEYGCPIVEQGKTVGWSLGCKQ